MAEPAPPRRPAPLGPPRKPHPTTEERQALPPFVGLPLHALKLLSDPAELTQAIERMQAAKYVGFDTESKPSFVAGQSTGGPHLIQLALADVVYLISTRHTALMAQVKQLLESTQIIKVGFGLSSDRSPLLRNHGIALNGIIDLAQPLQSLGYKNELGAQAAVAVVLKQNLRKSKRMTMSNWQKTTLEPAQMQYAADDALASLRVFEALGRPVAMAKKRKPRPRRPQEKREDEA
jgi:ribonuclease D